MPWMSSQLPWNFAYPNPPEPTGFFTPLKFLKGPPVMGKTPGMSLANAVLSQMSGPPVMLPAGGAPNEFSGPPVMLPGHVFPPSGPPVLPSPKGPAGFSRGPTNTAVLLSSGPPVLIQPGPFIVTSPLTR